mgnify:CR=1 FL=1
MNTDTGTILAHIPTEQREPVMAIRGVYKSFGNNHVLVDFNLDLYKGENVVVLGKSGSGKSVLIKCIIGLLKPELGTIEVFNENIPDLDIADLDKIRARVGFLFQSNALYDSMTVRDNLEFPLRRHWIKVTQEEVNTMVMDALEDVGLAHTVDMMPVELSGGMRKRIALARTLILKPDIILYDEPTTGLHMNDIKKLLGSFDALIEQGHSILVIEHNTDVIKSADWVIDLGPEAGDGGGAGRPRRPAPCPRDVQAPWGPPGSRPW